MILEYASAGTVVATGAPYGNRYISVITLRDREVVRMVDYLDPVACLRRTRLACPLKVKRRPLPFSIFDPLRVRCAAALHGMLLHDPHPHPLPHRRVP